MREKHELIFKNDNMTLSKGCGGYWLYDKTRGMNLAMRVGSEVAAYQEALGYYHRRLPEVEAAHRQLCAKVEKFVDTFVDDEGDVEVNTL